jgi:chromosomal replication initiator protein
MMDEKKLWEKTLSEIELQLSKANFLTWFKNSRLIEQNNEAGCVTVGVTSNFAKEWIQTKYNKTIIEILQNHEPSINRVEYIVLSSAEAEKKIFEQREKQKETIPSQVGFIEFAADPETNLHPRYTFDSFVVGSSNELAFAASSAVTKEVGTKYNPLFVYGSTGLGKTHLIQAIGNEIIKAHKHRVRVKYVPSERFVNDVVWAIRAKRMDDIKNKYRNVDVLIIDDIQFIGGKERSEEEFFHTFNILYQNNKQIIISSDRAPSAIPTLEDRLRSRFEAGLIADITYPDYEMKLAIIKNKVQEKKFQMPDDVCHLIATKIQRNVREIEGIINKLFFYKELKSSPITAQVAEEVINNTLQQNMVNINPTHLLKCVAQYFEVQPTDLTNKSRRKEVVVPRQIAMYLLRDMLGLSYPDIGLKMGKKDHTTAIHSYEKISAEIIKDKGLNQKIVSLKEIIQKTPA